MSMGNFIGRGVVRDDVMAASNRPARDADESSDAGVGLAHPTVVPTNFDSDADDGRED